MKKIGSVVLCCLGVTAVGASGALAGNGNSTPNPNQVASKICTGELQSMGAKAFKGLYGDPHKKDPAKKQRAMRNCKRQHGHQAGNVVDNAAQQCNAERADANFPATHGGETFDQFYGTNHNDKNSFGKCVSGKVNASVAQIQTNLENAAAQCRAERSDPNFAAGHGGKSFSEFYGTEKSKRKNAFGKCVSTKAKAQNETITTT